MLHGRYCNIIIFSPSLLLYSNLRFEYSLLVVYSCIEFTKRMMHNYGHELLSIGCKCVYGTPKWSKIGQRIVAYCGVYLNAPLRRDRSIEGSK